MYEYHLLVIIGREERKRELITLLFDVREIVRTREVINP